MPKKANVPGDISQKEVSQNAFIEAYIEGGGIAKEAADKIGIHIRTYYAWRTEEDFMRRLKEAQTHWFENIRQGAMLRARQDSDTLAKFFLEAGDPETYDARIRAQNHARQMIKDQFSKIEIEWIDEDYAETTTLAEDTDK
jgi:hypothetical protein